MAALKNALILTIPKAFLEVAKRHNKVVHLLEGIKGDNGVNVDVSEGCIRVSIDQAAFNSMVSDAAPSPTLPGSYTFTACVSGTPMNFDVAIWNGPY